MAEQAALPTNAAHVDPYAAPAADLIGDTDLARAERTRRTHLNHEVSIKGLGALYYLNTLVVTFVVAVLGSEIGRKQQDLVLEMGILLGVAALAVGAGALGYGLRRLRSWARVPAAVVSGFGLLAFPLGTLINGYFMYLTLGKKGRAVFSAEYAEVVEMTPHIKYRSIATWVALFLLGALVLVAFAAPLLEGRF